MSVRPARAAPRRPRRRDGVRGEQVARIVRRWGAEMTGRGVPKVRNVRRRRKADGVEEAGEDGSRRAWSAGRERDGPGRRVPVERERLRCRTRDGTGAPREDRNCLSQGLYLDQVRKRIPMHCAKERGGSWTSDVIGQVSPATEGDRSRPCRASARTEQRAGLAPDRAGAPRASQPSILVPARRRSSTISTNRERRSPQCSTQEA